MTHAAAGDAKQAHVAPTAAPAGPSLPNTSNATCRPLRLFITAAEVSGDRHAAQFIRSLRQIAPDVVVEGVGGPEMQAAGAVIHRNTVNNAAMGLRGALRAFEIYGLLRWTRRHFDTHKPDLWVGVDSPSMNFHFARAAKTRGIPTLQFVAPQLWAWAIWRMKKLRRWVDRVACILPFEEAFFRGYGVNASFVGHPLFDELPPGRDHAPPQPLTGRPPVVGLLPGSRKGVADVNFPRQLAVAAKILERFPDARFVVPTTDATDPIVRKHVAAGVVPLASLVIGLNDFEKLVPGCDLCVTVSGTATLHVASFGVPMIVVYAGSRFVWNVLGRWLIKMRTYAMVNLLADPTPLDPDPGARRHVVPEYVPWYGPVTAVADHAIGLLSEPARLADQREKLIALVRRLDHPGASDNVARMALEMVAKSAEPRLAV